MFNFQQWLRRLTRGTNKAATPRRERRASRPRLESLEDRLAPAITTFAGGVLSVDLNNANETATLTNDGTIVTLFSTNPITGAGAAFSTASVTTLRITDSGNNAGQAIMFAGTASFSLSGGLDSTGVETVTFDNAVTATGGSGIGVTAPQSIAVSANLTGGTGPLSLTGTTINLGANLSTDGGQVSIAGSTAVVIAAATVTIDTEAGNNGNAGAVSFAGTGLIRADAADRNLVINTGTSSASSTNGAVTLAAFGSTGGALVNNVTIDADGLLPAENGGTVTIPTGANSTIAGTLMIEGGTINSNASFTAGTDGTATTVTLVSDRGITDGNGDTVNFDAASLSATALNNISLGIDVANVEARAQTGEISLNNTGNLTIGGVSALTGVSITSSGGIAVTATGTLTVAEAVSTPSGGIALVGTAVDVNATVNATVNGNVVITATDTLTIAAAVSTGPGAISLTGTTINLGANLSTDGGQVSIAGSTAVVIAAATVTIDTEAGNNGNAGAVSFAGTGLIRADAADRNLVINTGTSSASSTNGAVTLAAFGSTGGALVNNVTIDADGLLPAENGGTVTIPTGANSTIAGTLMIEGGTINSNASFTAGTDGTATTVTLVSDRGITDGNGDTVNFDAASLSATALNNISLGIDVANVEAQAQTGEISLDNTGNLTIGGVGALVGVQVTGASGGIQLTNAGGVTVGEAVSAPGDVSVTSTGASSNFTNSAAVGTTGGNIIVNADTMAFNAAVNAGAGIVQLGVATTNRAIDLGSGTDLALSTLELSDDELDRVSAATLVIGNATTGTITVSATLTQPGKNLTLVTGAGVTGSGNITNGSATATTLTIDQAGTSGYSGAIGGPAAGTAADKDLAFVKQGIGALTLSGTSTYTGATNVNAGTLLVDGSVTGGGTASVNTSGTLGGSGTIVGPVTINAGGHLAPGAAGTGTGILATGILTFAAGSFFDVELNGTAPGTGHDQTNVTGSVTLGNATLALTLGFTPPAGSSYVIARNDGDAVSGTFIGLANGATVTVGGFTFRIFYTGTDGNDVTLVESTAPATAYVDDAWAGTSPGSFVLNDPVGGLIFGVTAFADVQGGIDAVAAGGSLVVFAGTYGAVNVNKALQPIALSTNTTVPNETAVAINGAVTLTTDATFNMAAAAGGVAASLTFGSTINNPAGSPGTAGLTVNGAPTTTFAGAVGGTSALRSLTTDTGGTTAIDGGVVTTTGNQTYDDAITLGSDTSLTGADLTFGSTLTGLVTLSLTAAGNVTATGAVGTLSTLTITTAVNATFNTTLTTDGNVTQSAGTGTTTFKGGSVGGALAVTTKAITLSSATLNTVGAVNLNAQDAVTFTASLDAGASTITIAANQDFTQSLGSIVTTSSAAVAVSVTVGGNATLQSITAGGGVKIMAGGKIEESGGDATAEIITSATIDLVAATGIGTAGRLEIDTPILTAAVTGTGSMTLRDLSGGLAVTSATTANGNIDVEAVGGTLTLTSASAGGSGVTLRGATLTSGDVVAAAVSAPNGTVSLNSANSVLDDMVSGTLISAALVVLTAGDNIGASTAVPLEFDATNLLVSTAGGDAFLVEQNSVTLHILDAGTAHLIGGTFSLEGNDRINDATTVSILGGSTLDLGVFSDTVTSATLVNGTIDGTGTLTATSFFSVSLGTVNAVLAGNVGLTKNGSGTVTLNNANTYTGSTLITGGPLVLSATGSIAAASSVTVRDGGVLAGTGTAFGSVTGAEGGTVSPGTSPGVLDTGAIDFQDFSTLKVEFGGPTPGDAANQYDQVVANGAVNIGANVTLNLSSLGGYQPSGGETFVLVKRTGGTGSFASLPEGATIPNFLGSGLIAAITYAGGDGNDIALTAGTIVSVEATTAVADENGAFGPNVLVFTFRRGGSTAGTLPINFTLGGTATSGADYGAPAVVGGTAPSAGRFVFAAGSATMTVTYTTVNDVPAEAEETVVVTLTGGEGYAVSGTEGSATGRIIANDFAVTNTNSSGEGSLRQAVTNANAFEGQDEVTFEEAVFADLTPDVINLNGSRLTLTDTSRTTVTGPGAKMLTIAGAEGGIFHVVSGAEGAITGVKLTEETAGDTTNDPAIENDGLLDLDGVWITGFQAFQEAAGLINRGTAAVRNSTFSDNFADNSSGGAIHNAGTLTLTNVTLSGNRADAGGGGLYQESGTTALAQVTITNNRADEANVGGSGGGVNINAGTATAVNSIISGNFSGTGTTADDVAGAGGLTANFSLIGATDAALGGGANNKSATNPRLDPLRTLGGTMPTHLIFPTSPALNGGSNALVPGGLSTDQRGRTRIVGPRVDMGATETQVPSFRVRNKLYKVRAGRTLNVPATKGPLVGVVQQGSNPRVVQLVIPPAAKFGTLTLNEDGSLTFVPRTRAAMTVRFFARVFNGQEWSAPFKVTLVFFNPLFGRRR